MLLKGVGWRTPARAWQPEMVIWVVVLVAQIDPPDDKTLNEITKLRGAARGTVT